MSRRFAGLFHALVVVRSNIGRWKPEQEGAPPPSAQAARSKGPALSPIVGRKLEQFDAEATLERE
jgi:hypothetical protein